MNVEIADAEMKINFMMRWGWPFHRSSALLEHQNSNIRRATASLLEKLAEHGELQ